MGTFDTDFTALGPSGIAYLTNGTFQAGANLGAKRTSRR